MGPHFFKCGKARVPTANGANNRRLQWGRTFSSAESIGNLQLLCRNCNVFNGAALFQVRKGGEEANHQTVGKASSMGPHFFKCGKVSQRGARILCWRVFNGAALFQVRKGYINSIDWHGVTHLQWGRTFSSAERLKSPRNQPKKINLQWGRTFSSAERNAKETASRQQTTVFNGAALFQVRKVHHLVGQRLAVTVFNGAALFQVRKALGLSPSSPSSPSLQWGRTFSSAESLRLRIIGTQINSLQWGRTFSSAES